MLEEDTTNYGVAYTAKGTAAILAARVAAYMMFRTGLQVPVFYLMVACDTLAQARNTAKKTQDEKSLTGTGR